MEPESKSYKPFADLAALMNLYLPGLGYLYLGRLKLAAIILPVYIFFVFSVYV